MALLNPFQKIYKKINNKAEIPEFPRIVDIELTNYCNNNCLFCGQQTMKRMKGFMSKKVFEKVVKECSGYNTPIRMIRWGEPFLHPNIIEFVRYIKSKNLLAHITTNGLGFKKGQIEELPKIGLDSIIFSFQGATKEGYQLMRNNNRYDELIANIKKLSKIRKDKPFIHITSTMTDESEKEIEQFKRQFDGIADLVTIGKTNLSRLSIGQFNVLRNIKKLETLKKQERINKEYQPCVEVFNKLSVDWDGKVSACCADWDNYMTIGDINEQTLKDIWDNSKRLKMFREVLKDGGHKCLTLCSVCYKTYDFKSIDAGKEKQQ